MLRELFRNCSRIFWLLPGFLLWAAFPPMGEKTDVLFALAPLMWLSRRADAGKSCRRWFANGLLFWIATLSWMPAIVKNGGPWPLVVLGWLGLAAYCSAFFAAYGYLAARIWRWVKEGSYLRRLLAILVIEPVLWCGLELIRSRFLGGFAWNQLGVVPANGGLGAPASLGGVYLLSAIVILINGSFAGIAERIWKPEASGFANLRRLGTLETILVFALVWGAYQVDGTCASATADDKDNACLKVGLVQRNFPCVFREKEENPYQVYSNLLENIAHLKPDLVVLPESAMCEFGPVDQQGAIRFASWVSANCDHAELLAGGTRYGDGRTYNSAAVYSDSEVQLYDKVHLVPFGEFIPGDKWITALQKLAPVGSCTPGELHLVNLTGRGIGGDAKVKIPAGVAICFEDTDSAQMRALAAMGAKALVFITNDSWFSKSVEAEQHSWQAVARAIETGLPVVRVGNSGVTGTIAPDGKATWILGPNGRVLVDRRCTMFDRLVIPETARKDVRTAYVALGDWPLVIVFLLLILGIILVQYRNYYEKRRYLSM